MEALSAFIGGIVGFLASVLTEPVKNFFFGARLKVEFNPEDPGCATDTKESSGQGFNKASYIRVLVTNTGKSIAKECRAYLKDVEIWNTGTGRFEATEYCESMQLAWSATPKPENFLSVDIPNGISRFVDVISVRDHSREITTHVPMVLYRYEEVLQKQTGKFRYTVLVAGDNLKPKSTQVVFEWNGKFGQQKVSKG